VAEETLTLYEVINPTWQFQPISLNRSIEDGSTLNPPQAPRVQPAYYAAILVARAIGKTGKAKISEVTVADSNVSGYAIYEGSKLVRAVFINLNAWLLSSTGTRPSVTLAFSLGSNGPKTATGRRLVIAHADDTAGLNLEDNRMKLLMRASVGLKVSRG